jgi:hypothetical protein
MTLDQPQIRELRKLIETLLPTRAELDLFLQDETDVGNLDRVASGDNLRLIVNMLCVRANKDGWMGQIVEGLASQFPASEEVRAFAERIKPPQRQAGRANTESYDACYLDGRPFVDRINLRTRLRDLQGESQLRKPRILIVRGEAKTGKTHSNQLIKHVAKEFSIESVHVDLMRISNKTRDLSPVDIGKIIAGQMKLKDMPLPGNEQLARWPAAFFSWLAGELRDDPRRWWIVIDGFTSVKVSQEVHDFVDDLADSVDKLEPLANCRVVLISYDDTLLAEYSLIMDTDVTEAIDESHLSLFFAQFYRDYGPPDDDETMQSRISEELMAVLQTMIAEPADRRMKRMEEELRKSCQRLAG